MKLSDIPFNVGFHFDEHLREVPDDPDEMSKAISFLLRARKRGEDIELMQIDGWLSVFCRILGDLDQARAFANEAVTIADDLGDDLASVQNRIRLANVLQWEGEFALADAHYESLVMQCRSQDGARRYLDFALQHYGKSLYDQERYREAADLFRQALEIRLAAGNEGLIASSRLALATAEQRISL